MYPRTTKRKNRDGSEVEYLQLAENTWNPKTRRSETSIVYNYGRVDDKTKDQVERLIKNLRRFCEPEEVQALSPSFRLENTWPYGDLYALGHLWERLGLKKIIQKLLREEERETPLERAIFLMVANRCLAPAAKLYCYTSWLQDDIYFPEGEGIGLHHLYRGMDFLLRHKEKLEWEIFDHLANLLNLHVDLIFYDTTSLHFEIDEEDEASGEESSKGFELLRKRGHSKNGREDAPQVVVGLAVTQEGFPVRSWVFDGNTVDVTTVAKVKKDLAGWKLHRCVFVGDRGMVSDENLEALSVGGGRYILGMPMRREEEVSELVLGKAGRFKKIRENLKVKEIWIPGKDGGERRRRYVVCYNPEEAERQRHKRQEILSYLEVELALLKERSEDHPKRACELLASKRYGKYLKALKNGKLVLDLKKVKSEERLDGKYVIFSNDDSLSAEDLALGYKQLARIEATWLQMKSGLRMRPVFHWSPQRIRAHVFLCVLALLLERYAEHLTGETWRNVRDSLKKIKVAQFFAPQGMVLQTSEPKPETLKTLKLLGVPKPPVVLRVAQ